MKFTKTEQNILNDSKEFCCHINASTKLKLKAAFKLANAGLITLVRQTNDYGHFWYVAHPKKAGV